MQEQIDIGAIEGCLRWQADGLTEPDSVRADTDAYRRSEDMLQQWFTDEGWTLTDNGSVPAGVLLESWTDWTEKTLGRKKGGQEMAKRLAEAGCDKIHGRPVRWLGIGKLDTP